MLLIVFLALTAVYFFLFDARAVDQNKTSNVLLINAVTAAVYIAFSAYRFVHFELGPLDNRMMIPIFVPLILILAVLVDRINFSFLKP